MPRTADRSLLPESLRARLDAGEVTNGEYHRLLPTFPDAALCDHADVYAQHCTAASLVADHGVPEAYLHHFILPELVARLRGTHAAELTPPAPRSIFRRLLTDWDACAARVGAAIVEQRRLAALPPDALADDALRARDAVHCRWAPRDLVYDGSIYHTIIPELARRGRRTPNPPGDGGSSRVARHAKSPIPRHVEPQPLGRFPEGLQRATRTSGAWPIAGERRGKGRTRLG
jgi:hypothetical protein